MSFYSKVLDNIILAAKRTDPYADIVYGSDPPINGICMIPSPGTPENTFFDKGMIVRMPVLLNGKHEDQRILLDDLTAIHEVLTKRRNYSDLSTEAVQVTNIASMTLPQIIGREQNKQWVCGSTLEVSFYWKSVEFFNINL